MVELRSPPFTLFAKNLSDPRDFLSNVDYRIDWRNDYAVSLEGRFRPSDREIFG